MNKMKNINQIFYTFIPPFFATKTEKIGLKTLTIVRLRVTIFSLYCHIFSQ